MRVLHVLTSDQRRGAELSAMALRQELQRQGHDATAVALAKAVHGPHLPVEVLGSQRRLGATALRGLRRRALNVDVVLAHGSSTLPACAVALTGSGTPFVYANIGDPLYWADSAHKRLRVRLLLSRAQGVAARSEQSRQTLRRHLGVSADRLEVIPNGRDVARFRPASPDQRLIARRARGVHGDGFVVLYVGALAPEKRVDIAILAVAQLPDVTLLVTGDGPERDALVALADDVAPGRVRFLGQVDDVPAVLQAADAVVLTSRSEGLPGTLIEAGLSGLPVVSTAVGFVSDIVVDGETGLLVPPGDVDAVAAALRTVLGQQEMGLRARERCLALFDMEIVAAKWESLLEGAVAASRRTSAGSR